jgi:hypothetical protein
MKLYDGARLPVIEDPDVGILDESDLLMAVAASSGAFSQPVPFSMVTDSGDSGAPMADPMPIFHKDLSPS